MLKLTLNFLGLTSQQIKSDDYVLFWERLRGDVTDQWNRTQDQVLHGADRPTWRKVRDPAPMLSSFFLDLSERSSLSINALRA